MQSPLDSSNTMFQPKSVPYDLHALLYLRNKDDVKKRPQLLVQLSKTPSLGSQVRVSGSGSLTTHRMSARIDGNYVKATSFKDPDVSILPYDTIFLPSTPP